MAFFVFSHAHPPRKCLSTDDEFRAAVTASLSVRQVLHHIGLVPAGGNYKTVHSRIQQLGLDTSHFMGKGWNTGVRFRMLSAHFSWEGILIENSPYTSTLSPAKPPDSARVEASCM